MKIKKLCKMVGKNQWMNIYSGGCFIANGYPLSIKRDYGDEKIGKIWTGVICIGEKKETALCVTLAR